MAALLGDLGGKIETGVPVRDASQLPPADVTIFDLAPEAVAGILGDRLPRRISRPSASSGVARARSKSTSPWRAACPGRTRTRTGPARCMWPATTANWPPPSATSTPGGCPSGRSFWSGQQYLADPQRSVGNVHPVWTYAHVPNGYSGDATAAIIAQIERFAPGFRERIVGTGSSHPRAVCRL